VLSGVSDSGRDGTECCETPETQVVFWFEKVTPEGVPRELEALRGW
jgi:hypothetical protein